MRIPLDLTALEHSAVDGGDIHVFGPAGRELPVQVWSGFGEQELRAVEVVKVEEEGPGWWIYLDLGSEPQSHRRLRFDFSEQTLAAGAVLEASPDDAGWRPLAEADLFQLGAAEGEKRTDLSYAAVDDRYLRLWWPQEAGFPRVRAILLERTPRHEVRQLVEMPACELVRPGATRCLLELEAPGARRLTLEVRSSSRVGYRLRRADGGRWKALRQGTLHFLAAQGASNRVLGLTGLGADTLELELFAAEGEAPVLVRYQAEYATRMVAFVAETAGDHTLVYGGEGRLDAPPWGSRGVADPIHWPALGPELRWPRPPLPAMATAPGAALTGDFLRQWEIEAEELQAGEIARLEVPSGAYRASSRALADLRLGSEGRQVPFVLRRIDEPVVVASADVELEKVEGASDRSFADLDLSAAASTLARITLSATEAPFRKRVRARFPRTARPGVSEPERWVVGWTAWECRSAVPLPCRLELDVFVPEDATLRFEFDDGDNQPLASLSVEVSRPRDQLVFVWPRTASVRLLAGSADLGPADYDLALLEGDLLSRPSAAVTVADDGLDGVGADKLGRRLLIGALVLAVLVLLVVLYRLLPARQAGSAP